MRSVLAGVLLAALFIAEPSVSKPPPRPPRVCCRVPAGAVVEIALDQDVSTKHQRTGDRFALRLAAPLVVNGWVVIRAGAPGVGEVVSASHPGMGGKPAKLVLAARYLETARGRVPLEGLQLAAAGKDNSLAANAVGLSGIAFGPLGFLGLAVPGGNVEFPAGTSATAEVTRGGYLPALGPAPRGVANAPLAFDSAVADTSGSIPIDPPPPGMGEVVFFRAKTLLGTGQWFNVRENGQALGKLSNGAYFVQVAQPGVHVYTATLEPEAKDKLRIEVDPGQIYFVQGALTKGLAVGLADLSPSNHAAFDKASKSLKLAAAPAETDDDDLSKYPPASGPDSDGR